MSDDKTGGVLRDRVMQWLRKQGYPIEYQVTAEMRRAGFFVRQSTYVDLGRVQEGGSFVEVDVTGGVKVATDGFELVAVQVVECKYAPTPWVVLAGRDNKMDPARVARHLITNRVASKVVGDSIEALQLSPLFAVPALGAGFSVVPSRPKGPKAEKPDELPEEESTKKEDRAYAYIRQLAVETRALAAKFDNDLFKHEGPRVAYFAMPVLVVKGHIFIATQDDDDELHLEETDQARLLWWGSEYTNNPIVIDLVSTAASADFFKQRHKDVKHVLSAMAATVKKYPADEQFD